jgi:hypothetical protein
MFDVIEELRHNEIGTSIDLGSEVIEFAVFVDKMVRMAVRVSCVKLSWTGRRLQWIDDTAPATPMQK